MVAKYEDGEYAKTRERRLELADRLEGSLPADKKVNEGGTNPASVHRDDLVESAAEELRKPPTASLKCLRGCPPLQG